MEEQIQPRFKKGDCLRKNNVLLRIEDIMFYLSGPRYMTTRIEIDDTGVNIYTMPYTCIHLDNTEDLQAIDSKDFDKVHNLWHLCNVSINNILNQMKDGTKRNDSSDASCS